MAASSLHALVACACTVLLASGASSAPRAAKSSKPAPEPVTITLFPTAVTTHGEVTIGDVATVAGGEAALRGRIAALDLADAPDLGKSARLTRDLITHRVRISGVDERRYRIGGADSVTVTSRGYRVPEQDIVDAARKFLQSRLPWTAADMTIEPSHPIRGVVQVPGNRDNVRFEASLRAPRISLGSVRVDVAVISKGVKQAEVGVMLEVHLYQTIALAARRIERGQPIAAEDVYFERRAVDSIGGYLTESDSPVGQKAKRVILPLQAVTRTDIDSGEANSTVVIKQRDVVQMVARAGGLVVTASGEALQDGRVGQMIRVRNVDSKTVVTGRVVSRNEVQVLN